MGLPSLSERFAALRRELAKALIEGRDADYEAHALALIRLLASTGTRPKPQLKPQLKPKRKPKKK